MPRPDAQPSRGAPGRRLNCWQVMACGREPGGTNATERGVCPAAADRSYDGINSGQFGGRICWAVAGTLCQGRVQGEFAKKLGDCRRCEFFQQTTSCGGAAPDPYPVSER